MDCVLCLQMVCVNLPLCWSKPSADVWKCCSHPLSVLFGSFCADSAGPAREDQKAITVYEESNNLVGPLINSDPSGIISSLNQNEEKSWTDNMWNVIKRRAIIKESVRCSCFCTCVVSFRDQSVVSCARSLIHTLTHSLKAISTQAVSWAWVRPVSRIIIFFFYFYSYSSFYPNIFIFNWLCSDQYWTYLTVSKFLSGS